MALARIEQLLQRHMGLHSATVGSTTVAHAVEQRMRACDIDSIEAYAALLAHAQRELDALIDTVIIPETWFFRDRNPFLAFSRWVSEVWLAHARNRRLRILSVPCSSGEEAYTLAMCLADCGVAPDAAHIDAVDISNENIARAARAVYGNNSFRGDDLAFRDRHFKEQDGVYALHPQIREYVSFQRANLLEPGFIEHRDPYDVIFCRNLLIYFDRPTQHRAIDTLECMLNDEGLLFLGHSETSLLLARNFAPLDQARCFGFRRTPADTPGPQADRPPAPLRTVRRERPGTRTHSGRTRAAPAPNPAPPPLAPPAKANVIDQAFSLANQGHLDEAAGLCEALLAGEPQHTEALYLLGLVRQSAGNLKEAEQLYRKAIYLDPDHYQALTHLGIVCRQHGDSDSAARLEQRAARAQQRIKSGRAAK